MSLFKVTVYLLDEDTTICGEAGVAATAIGVADWCVPLLTGTDRLSDLSIDIGAPKGLCQCPLALCFSCWLCIRLKSTGRCQPVSKAWGSSRCLLLISFSISSCEWRSLLLSYLWCILNFLYLYSAIGVTVFNILDFPFSSNFVFGVVLQGLGSPTLLCILGSRMMFNLKEAAEIGVNEGTSYRFSTTVTGMEFADANPYSSAVQP